MKIKSHKLIYFTTLMLIAFGLKLFHSRSTVNDLMFILKPVNFLVGSFQAERGIYLPDEGFYYESHGIIIDKSCAGMNFLIVAWCALGTVYIPRRNRIRDWMFHFTLLAGSAYLLTLISNASRITCAIQLIPFRQTFPSLGTSWFHQAMGSFIYLITLITVTLHFNHIHQKNQVRYA